MPVFPIATLEAMQLVLTQLVAKYAGVIVPTLSPEEVVDLFVHPDHVAKLREVGEMVGLPTGARAFQAPMVVDGRQITLGVTMHRGEPILMPAYVKGGVQPTASPETVQRIEDAARERIRMGLAAGLVHQAMDHMNNACNGSAKAFTMLIPCTAALMSRIEAPIKTPDKYKDQAARLLKSKAAPALPVLARETRQRIYEAAQTVSALFLAEDARAVQCPARGALVSVNSVEIRDDDPTAYTPAEGPYSARFL